MADPFNPVRYTVMITTKTGSVFKLLIEDDHAAQLMKEWMGLDPTCFFYCYYVQHSEGVLQVDLRNVEAINALTPGFAKQQLLESLSV